MTGRAIRRWLRRPQLDLPLGRDASGRFLPWIVAVMVYLAAIGGVGLTLLNDALNHWDRSLAATLTVQLPADTSPARIETAVALLRQTPGAVSAEALDAAATARLVEPWLGPGISAQTLPLPRLIDFRIDPAAAIDLAALREKLASVAPGARIDDHRLWLDRLRSFGLRVEAMLAAVVILVAALMALAVVFAVRTGLAIHYSVIELLHLLGAGDPYVARQFQTDALRHGLIGGAIGATAAAVTVLILAGAGRAVALPMGVVRGLGDWRLWGVLVVAALSAGLVSLATARITVLRRLGRLP